MSSRRLPCTLLVVLATLVAPATVVDARASSFALEGFVTEEDGLFVLDEPLLAPLLTDMLAAVQPHSVGTGSALGPGGFALSLGLGLTPIDPASPHWAAADVQPGSDLGSLQLSARVGTSDSLDLGVHLAQLADLDLTSASLALRWSLFSGRRWLPNVSVGLDAGALVGHPSMTMAHAGASLAVGLDIPVAGLMRISPFAGYTFRFGHTLGRQIAVFADAEAEPLRTVLPGQPVLLHEAPLGLLLSTRPLDLLLEVDLGTRTAIRLGLGLRL